MADTFNLIKNLQVPVILVLAGCFLILLALVRQLQIKGTSLKILPARQKLAAIFGVILVFLGIFAYVFPTAASSRMAPSTPGVTVSPIPSTATPVASSTATSVQSPTSASAPYGGRLILDDTLQNNSAGRWDADNPNSSGNGCRFIQNAYHVNAINFYHECADNSDNFDNDAYQVKIVLARGSSGGIEFRRSANTTYYSFSIGWSGQYEFFKVDSHQNITSIFHGRILADNQQTYVIGIVANKSSFTFYINNIMLQSPSDSTYAKGALFLFVDGSNEARTPVTQAIFSDLKIWAFNW